MEKARQHSTLTFAGGRDGQAERRHGEATRSFAIGGLGAAAAVATAVWLFGGWSAGQATAAFMCAALVLLVALHSGDQCRRVVAVTRAPSVPRLGGECADAAAIASDKRRSLS